MIKLNDIHQEIAIDQLFDNYQQLVETLDGQLNPECPRDGIHLNGDRCRVWRDAIKNRVTLAETRGPLTLFH